jgi:hypothetical protein
VLGFHSAFWLLTLSVTKVVDPWLRHSLWTPKFKLEAHLLCKRMNSV